MYCNIQEKFDIEYLSKLSTKRLLLMKEHLYPYLYCPIFNSKDKNCNSCKDITKQNYALLKQVLSNREHIPNKKEAKKIRQEKAKKS